MTYDKRRPGTEYFDTIVIGGGQTGLTVGYELVQRGVNFVILDANERVGDAWRKRWDSLLLFTPARYNGLPGMKFPAKADQYISKDELATYLETYAEVNDCLLYTSDAADDLTRVDLGGRR